MNSKLEEVFKKANEIIMGKEEALTIALNGLLCQGHLLIEDIPGVGKTTMVYVIGRLLGLNVSRIQFTNDLLPSDILGTSVFRKKTESFSFHKGPIFGNLILADELNRATPKTQSALLQVMEEKKVSIDGEDFEMESPFVIMATQNPYYQMGTYPLPESQLDRFFMSLSLGLPTRDYEKLIIQQKDMKGEIDKIESLFSPEEVKSFFHEIWKVKTSDELLNYVIDLLHTIRQEVEGGEFLSPRAGKDLILASKGHAFIQGRSYVIPEDIQFVIGAVVGHRIKGQHPISWGVEKTAEVVTKVPC